MDKQTQLSETRKKYRAITKDKLHQDSKERLKRISSKKFKTCFISAISEFEEVFGKLWGHGLPDEKLSETQRVNRELWGQIRTNILNKGNTQLRAMEAEIELHDIMFQGYKIEMGGKDNESE